MLFCKVIAVYSENHTEPVTTFCGQNAKLLNVKAGGAYNYQWHLNVCLMKAAWPQQCRKENFSTKTPKLKSFWFI
jgi:hypothetical protein